MKTYQAFARTKKNSELILIEIKAKNISEAKKWFADNTVENEEVFLKK
jgi:hypothetical protein